MPYVELRRLQYTPAKSLLEGNEIILPKVVWIKAHELSL
jgi:hypothetical protein